MPRSTSSQLLTGSKKRKRGARGSTKEDANTCKRVNMTATEDRQDQEPTTEEPAITATETSLEELKEMLVDIQTNISDILLENKSIWNELVELATTVREQKLEIAHLKTSQTKITKQCADAEYELAAAGNVSTKNKTKYMSCMSYKTEWRNTRGKIILRYMVCQRVLTARQRR